MARQTRELVVFVASPSDLPVEREAVRKAARTVNETVGRWFDLRLNVEGWEQVQPTLGRPQATINPLVDECDMFVGLLNKKWGSPTGTHSSGFEEEFQRVLERQSEVPPPRIGLFFARVPADQQSDPGPELTKVLAFQQTVRDEHTALYKQFTDTEDLERLLQAYLADFVAEHVAVELQPPEGATSPGGTDLVSSADMRSGQVDDAGQQLSNNLRAWAEVAHGGKPNPDPDRDRLLSFALALNQDDLLLGAHVANRLYRRRAQVAISIAEADLWLRTMCADAGQSARSGWDRVIPGWFFHSSADRGAGLLDIALRATGTGQRGALTFLTELVQRPTRLWGAASMENADDGDVDASLDSAAELWISLLSGDNTRGPAVNYLFAVSTVHDGPLFDAIRLAVGDEQPSTTEALAAMSARQGDTAAAVAYALTYPYSLEGWVVQAVLAALPTMASRDLMGLIDSRLRNETLRMAAFDQLLVVAPDEPGGVTAVKAMLRGSDASQAHLLECLRSGDERVRQWFARAWSELRKDDEVRRDMEERVLAVTEPTESLVARLRSDWSGLKAWSALGHQAPPSLADRAREVLRSDGAAFVEPQDDALGGDDPDSRQLREWVIGRAREAALQILAAVAPSDRTKEDLELARHEIAHATWVFHTQAIITLAEIGEAEDVPEIIDAAVAAHLRGSDLRRILTRACQLGGREVAARLIEREEEDFAIIGAGILVDDGETTDDELVELLYHRTSDVRRIALRALVPRLDRDGLEMLLDEYPQRGGFHWYNVIVGLDWHLYGGPAKVE